MTKFRLGLLSLFALLFVAGLSTPLHAQIYIPCGVAWRSHEKCAGSSGGASEAQQKIDEINRNTAKAQEAIKEGIDRLRDELEDHSDSRSSTGGSSECVRTVIIAMSYVCDDPNWRCIVDSSQCKSSDESSESDDAYISDEPYVSDTKDKILPAERIDPEELAAERLERQHERDAADLLRDSQQLLQTTDCAALMSTYRPGPARSLPPECMSEAEAMSVYTPIGRSQPQLPSLPEPVIDGSNIPSIIDFTLGPSLAQPSQAISPSLQQLTNQIDNTQSEPTDSPLSSDSQFGSPSLQISKAEDNQGADTSQSSADGSTQVQGSQADSESGSGGVIDRIFVAGKKAQDRWKDFRIGVGDRLRGITRDADGAPTKASHGNANTDFTNQDEADVNRAQNPANLGKGFNKYDSDLHDTTNKKIDKILDP